MRDFLITVGVGLVTIFVVVWCLGQLSGIPTVHESWSTGQCVRVENAGDRYNCEFLPPKFHHKWVQ